MVIPSFPFQIIDWSEIKKETHNGESGIAYWQILHVGTIRIRKVEYSENYKADHWCKKGHIIHCLEGNMTTNLEDGRKMQIAKGMTYIVSDDGEAHSSASLNGCTLFIVD
jgi:quercetin dioxygenase-like cupin family protein